jgi:hypothetical protein
MVLLDNLQRLFITLYPNMITTKYESPPDYQKLKQQRLREIQETYFPPPKKSCFLFRSPPARYIPTDLYQPDYDDEFTPSPIFEVKNSVKLHTFIIALLIFGCFFTVIPNADGSLDTGYYVLMGLGLIGIVYSVIKICDKTAYLTIDPQGLYFYNSGLLIRWEHVIALYFFIEEYDDDATQKLIVDYIDTTTDTCNKIAFPIKDYDKNLGQIALALQYYQLPNNQQSHYQYERNQQHE